MISKGIKKTTREFFYKFGEENSKEVKAELKRIIKDGKESIKQIESAIALLKLKQKDLIRAYEISDIIMPKELEIEEDFSDMPF
jgi:hypothetical protein